MTVCQVLLGIILLNQLVVILVNRQESCSTVTEGDIREVPVAGDGRLLVQYCTTSRFSQYKKRWHNLCAAGVGWTPTLATVVCRELPGYSDQGAGFGRVCSQHLIASITLNQSCTGNENRLSECGGVIPTDTCVCQEINCERQVPTSDPPSTTTIETDLPTVSQESDTTTTVVDNGSSPTNTVAGNEEVISQEDEDATAPTPCDCAQTTTVLGAVIGVLVVLQSVTMTTLCGVCVYWRHSVKAKQSSPDPYTERNESYSLHQHGYNDPHRQPNSSLGPTYEVVTNVDKGVDTYDVIGK